jgi:hypothetical protein
MHSLAKDLSGPETELIQTHTAWVFVGPHHVLKVKKPVALGFLDFSTIERRKAACEAEVRLNARLSPDVYRSVVPITRDESGTYRVGGDGAAVDYGVHMRRLPDEARADLRLAEGRLKAADVTRVADHLASFHASLVETTSAAARFGAPAAIAGNLQENFRQAHDAAASRLSEREAEEIERQQSRFLERERARFENRVRDGRVRDGHGDLRLEHVYFEHGGPPTIIDCLEFNDRFRYADVCADVAFLSMDLRRLGASELAETFLAAYARASGDYELYRLIDFYEGYRAYVRGKVLSILAEDRGMPDATREGARREARSFFLLSLLEGRRSFLQPFLVAVGGIIASGKSTISDHLGGRISAPVVASDRTRKELLGVGPTEPVREGAWSGAYSPEFSERVYGELFERAGHVLSSGRPVLLDASFHSRVLRRRARVLARRHGARFYFVECRASARETRRRLAERARRRSLSDGRSEIFDEFVARFEPVTELEANEHYVVDTEQPLEESLRGVSDDLPVPSR